MSRTRSYLRSNALGLVAIFLALTAGAYAAGLDRNSVKSKQIKDGAVKEADLAGGAVTSAKVADNSLSGGDVDEASLQGVDGAKVGGMEVKKINFQVPFGTNVQNVLVYPGIFRIDAQCQNFGDWLDVAAVSGKENASIMVAAVRGNAAHDEDALHDLVSRADLEFDEGDTIEVDSTSEFGAGASSAATVQFSTPEGFVATTELSVLVTPTGCKLTGVSVAG